MRTLVVNKLFILFLIILIGAVFRIYRLADFPIQLNQDEMSQLYDAISVATTGKDIYGNFLPTMFVSVNDYKSPFYSYVTALTYFILGNHEWIIRIPGVLFGILIIPAVYLLTRKLFKNYHIALLVAFFIAISPADIFFARKSFENVPGIFFMIMVFYFLFVYFDHTKYLRWLNLAAISTAAGMYTYFSHAVILPILLFLFILIFRKNFTLKLTKYLKVLLLFIILITPLLLIVVFNPYSRYRSQTVFITQDVNLGKRLDYTGTSNQFLSQLLRYKTILDFSFNRYLEQFSPAYFFASGLDFTNQNPLNMGPMLFFQLPFIMFGLIYLIKKPHFSRQNKFIFCWIVLGTLPSGLTFETHSPHRSIMVFTMLNIIAAGGAYLLINKLKNYKKLILLTLGSEFIILVLNILYFIHMYFINFPFEKSQYLQYPFKQVAEFAWSQYQNFDNIVFDPQFGDIESEIGVGAHYYFAYYGYIPPYKFQQQFHAGNKPREVIFDKFSIRQVYWPADRNLKNTLVIASPWSVPEQDIQDKNKIMERFYFYNGKLAFYAIKL